MHIILYKPDLMKIRLTYLLLAISNLTFGKVYYISNNGSDGAIGTSISTPWQTIAKVNTSFKFIKPGDTIAFKGGETFYGSLVIGNSGTAANPIVITSYGNGQSKISGFNRVKTWINLGNNIWESSTALSNLQTCNMVVVNGNNTPMGRYPNTGFFTIQSHIGATDVNINEYNNSINFTGGEIVIKIFRWALSRNKIINHEGHLIKYSAAINNIFEPNNGFGAFIQNHPQTLDTLNEWYYNPLTKKLLIYNPVKPTDVSISIIDTLVLIKNQHFITINNLAFEGANKHAIVINSSKYVIIKKCNVNFSGLSAVDLGDQSDYAKVEQCEINNSNDIGIDNQNSSYVTIAHNQINNTGLFPGMGSGFISSTVTYQTSISKFKGIASAGNYGNIIGNLIKHTGYTAIFFTGDGTIVDSNYINDFCFTMDDGGGIYSYSELKTKVWKTRYIRNNTVLNAIGAPAGTDVTTGRYSNQTAGIFLDAANGNFEVTNNFVANVDKGLLLNNSHDILIKGNTFYNNKRNVFIANYTKEINMKNISFIENKIIAGPLTVINLNWELRPDSLIPASFRAYQNTYTTLNDERLIQIDQLGIGNPKTLQEWQSLTKQEKKSNSQIIPLINLRFEVNKSNNDTLITLTGNHNSLNGIPYRGNIKVKPNSALLLIRESTIVPPTKK